MGTIKIGSASNRVGVTIEPNDVLFNGNGVKKIMSGTTEIWKHTIKALIPTMTSNTTPSGECSEYGGNSSYLPYRLFDNNTSTFWEGADTTISNVWVQYKFDKKTCVEKIELTNRSDPSNYMTSFSANLQGSNNGVDFNTITSISSSINNGEKLAFSFFNNNYYLYYRLKFTSATGSTTKTKLPVLSTLQFYG